MAEKNDDMCDDDQEKEKEQEQEQNNQAEAEREDEIVHEKAQVVTTENAQMNDLHEPEDEEQEREREHACKKDQERVAQQAAKMARKPSLENMFMELPPVLEI